MQSLLCSTDSWKEIIMNMIISLLLSKCEDNIYDAILVMIDHYTKMTRYFSTINKLTAVKLTDMFFEHIVLQYRTSREIVSDWESIFTSSYWSEVCYQVKVKCWLSTVFHPQTDGQTERQNQILEHYLHCYCIKEQDNWVNLLLLAEFTYINAKQATLECSSFFVLMKYNISIHYDVEDNAFEGEVPTAKKRIKKLHKIREMMLKCWERVVASQVRAYNKRHQPKSYWVGDLMLLLTKNLSQKHPHKKLSHKFAESFCICDIIGQQVYCLSLFISYQIHNVFHVSYLKLYSQHLNNETVSELPPSDLINETEKYEVEEILEQQKKKGELWYKIQWKDYSSEYDQWVKKQDMAEMQDLW